MSVVCRMTSELGKVSGVLEAVSAVEQLADRYAVRLLVVGEGPELARVQRAAAVVNKRTGQETVMVTGGLLDPRPAYDVADVVLGMGSSALRGLAFGKPLVVQGPSGFWELLTPDSAPAFLERGFMGYRPGDGVVALTDVLQRLLPDAPARASLGAFGRRLVAERFSLTEAAARQEEVYRRTSARRWSGMRRAGLLTLPAAEVTIAQAVLPRLRAARRRLGPHRAASAT